jgi:hypothetical protein
VLYKALKDSVDNVGNIIIPIISEDWQAFWEIFTVRLPYVPAAGQKINIYIKRKDTNITTRVDDENYIQYGVDGSSILDSSTGTNPAAEIPTFVGNGVADRIQIGQYLLVNDGDMLIFRPEESDGSVSITDENILDTNLSGGSLSAISSAYATAIGTSAEEILISGGKFIDKENVPAPEENIPGQVIDSVSIKVYNNKISGAAALQSKITPANGQDTVFAVGQTVLENSSIFVYVDNTAKILGQHYTIDFTAANIDFISAPAAGELVEILSIGIGGVGIIDYQNYVADGTTGLFLTNAGYDVTSSVFVTLNGSQIDVGFRNSTDIIDAVGKTLVEFAVAPQLGDVIKIACLTSSSDVDSLGLSLVQVNTQTFYYEGSTRSFDLDGFSELARGSSLGSTIVEANGQILKGPDTNYVLYDGTNNQFTLGLDPFVSGGSILPSDIKVYINNILSTFVIDYTFNGPDKVLIVKPERLVLGDKIKIENSLSSQYSIQGNTVTIDSEFDFGFPGDSTSADSTYPPVVVTWFGDYPSMNIIQDETAGGKVNYQLAQVPVSVSYVWVYVNGIRLRQEQDYFVSLPRAVVYLNVITTPSDDVKIVIFGNDIFKLPSAYEIHKDMLNVFHFNRFSKASCRLTKPLRYFDTTIEVSDASGLGQPIISRNLPGIVFIEGERIEYMTKTGNVLGQLRRGVQGTSIAEIYAIDTVLAEVGYGEVIPYNENQQRIDFTSDGSTLLIGPLDFIPLKGTRIGDWYRDTIPSTHGPCDQIEVFAGGRRLKKDPQDIYLEINGAASPEADQPQEAEFSVDGASQQIRLTTALPAGTRVTVIRRLGQTWHARGNLTAADGVSLIDTATPIAKFIVEKTTTIPE